MMIQTSDGKYVPVNIPALPANNPSPSKPESSQPPAQPVAPVVQVIQPTVQPAVANRNLPIVMGTANKMTGNHSNTGPGNVNASLLTKQVNIYLLNFHHILTSFVFFKVNFASSLIFESCISL